MTVSGMGTAVPSAVRTITVSVPFLGATRSDTSTASGVPSQRASRPVTGSTPRTARRGRAARSSSPRT